MPKESKFNYEFDINVPWKHGLLQASFDCPIYKSEETVNKERDSLLSNYQPYFLVDKEIEKIKNRISFLYYFVERSIKKSQIGIICEK